MGEEGWRTEKDEVDQGELGSFFVDTAKGSGYPRDIVLERQAGGGKTVGPQQDRWY